MGKPKHSCWEYVKSIQDPANPSKRRWQCKYCNKDYAGGASRIKVHLGLERGQGIEICQNFKKRHMSQVPENGMSSAAENAQVAGFPSSGLVFNQESLNIPPQTSLGGIQGPMRSIESEMDLSVHTLDLSVGNSTRLAATINDFAAAVDSQPPVDPSNIVPQQYDNQIMPCPNPQANPQHAMEQQNMSASTMNREPMVDRVAENPGPGVQSGLPPNGPDLPEEYHQADAMQVDRDTCSERGQRTGAAFPGLTRDAILVPELVGQEFNRVVNEIWDYITKENILSVGIYGMGGVGKTTIVKHLYNKVCANADFGNIFWVTVSKDCSIHQLQNKIAKAIKVPHLFEDADESMRPTLLFNHLSKQKKSLIILDDLWQHLELRDVGIPVMKDGIQLVLTTRNCRVCERMSCERTIGVKPLSNEESWTLFVRKFGADLSPSWEPTAKSIAEECKGMPLAIVVMAASMRGVHSDHGWEDTLETLKHPGALQEDMQTSVFPILRYSYDCLDAEKQQCLLQCALYPEDWKVCREELIELCIDEGVIRGDSRWKMHNKGHRLLDELEKACLLEYVPIHVGGYETKAVRMHDVIRDMALYIMNANSPCMVKSGLHLDDMPGEDEWMPNLQRVSLIKSGIRVVSSMSPNCPQLTTLLLSAGWESGDLPECFFEWLPGLKVIDLSDTGIRKVPESITNLEKLNALILKRCYQLYVIPSLAKLTSLKKLDLQSCHSLKEAPDGLGMLVNLTYLDFSDTSIEKISDGVIGKLQKLQYLATNYIEVKGEEIAKLKKLESLYCRFQNVNELSEHIQHATMIKSYVLSIGFHGYDDQGSLPDPFDDEDNEFGNPFSMWGKKSIFLGDIGQYSMGETFHLPRDVKTLTVEHYNGTWSDICRLEDLRVFKIFDCREVSALPFPSQQGDHCPNLKELRISRCPKLKHLLVPRHSCNLYFKKLEKLVIEDCGELESIIDEEESLELPFLSQHGDHFPNFNELYISHCPKLKHLLVVSGRSRSSTLYLKKLEKLQICGCEQLESIIGGATDEEESLTSSTSPLPPDAFSQLQSIKIESCPKMKNVVGPELLPLLHNLQRIRVNEASNMEEIIAVPSLSPPPPPPPGGHCPNLEELHISTCPKLKHLLVPRHSCHLYLKKLEKLEIWDCEELESIIGAATDEEESLTSSTSPLPPDAFSQLQSIQISYCPKMKNVVGPELLPLLHNLQRIHVHGASNMKEIIAVPSPTSIPAAMFPLQLPLLTSISVSGCLERKRVLTLELFMFLPNLQTIIVRDCKEMKEVIGGQELDHGATSSLFLSPIPAASPGNQLSTRKLALNLSDLMASLSPPPIPATTSTLFLPLLTKIYVEQCQQMKRVLTLELFMLLPNLQTIRVHNCKEMKEVIGSQELDPGSPSSLFLSPIPAASPDDQLSSRKLTLELDDLEELESICRWTGLRDLIHVIEISRCPKLKRIEMLDDASPPPSLKEIVLIDKVDGNRERQWWESLEWVHPEAKTTLEPCVLFESRLEYLVRRQEEMARRGVFIQGGQ
ncbi:probable disease resistance protein At4g27220 isoform X2 [Punica granatum]|uniref:Probable disease resistance protein At4g27220 isoform X2 n=1 Tax=Punica granatum TaxID=22663 RepID=A0A6P8CXI3_PUNGR|nr:probable disease resistance protein At4g27220 isoform X2 [Punica granatum]